MAHVKKNSHPSWINQQLILRYPWIADYLSITIPLSMSGLAVIYVKLAMYIWPFLDKSFFGQSADWLSGAGFYFGVILPVLCLATASIMLIVNELLTLHAFETNWQPLKQPIVGVVFLMIGGCTVWLNTAVFNAIGPTFAPEIGTVLEIISLAIVAGISIVFCWPAQSLEDPNQVSVSS